MPTFAEGLADAAHNGFCSVMSNLSNFNQLVTKPAQVLYGGSYNPAGLIYQLACNKNPPAKAAPPFTGGQCYDKLYRVFYIISFNPGGSDAGSTTIAGRVTGAEVRPFSDGSKGGEGYITGVSGNGTPISVYVGGGSAISGLSITNITVEAGGADDCGNPPSVTPPYNPGDNKYPTNIIYNDNDGNNFTIPVVLAFGYANVNAVGNFSIPINVTVNADPTLNFNFDFDLNTGKPSAPTHDPSKPVVTNPTDPSLPSPDPSPSPSPDPSYPDDPTDPNKPADPVSQRIIRGVLVSATGDSAAIGKIDQLIAPPVRFPDLGLVEFEIQVGTYHFWTQDIKVKNRRQFIECPWEYGAISVKGTSRPGISFTLTPVYVTRTIQPQFPPDVIST